VLPAGHAILGPHPGSIGHVTSSYYGARIGHSFALALVADGRARHGEPVWATLPDGAIAARICRPVFYNPDGQRRDG
jgi:sarcosine oxidase subunit alpha